MDKVQSVRIPPRQTKDYTLFQTALLRESRENEVQ